MDIGSGAATAFDWDDSISDYIMKNVHLMDMIQGHIHSHNNMGVFFSSVDMDELMDNKDSFNAYLSVIVNNRLDIIAKTAFVGKSTKFTCLNEAGDPYTLTLDGDEYGEVLFTYDCKIDVKQYKAPIPDSFVERVNVINKKKDAKPKYTGSPYGNGYGGYGDNSNGWPTQYPKMDDHYPKGDLSNKQGTVITNPAIIFPDKTVDETISSALHKLEEEDNKTTVEELFLCYLLRLGIEQSNDDIVNALEDIETSGINVGALIESLFKNFNGYFHTFFARMQGAKTADFLISTLEKMSLILSMYKSTYDFVQPIIDKFQGMIKQIESNLKKKEHEKSHA